MYKSVLITGASRGIGFAACEGFLKAGWQVFACARDIHPLEDLSKEYPSLIPIVCDLRDPEEIGHLFDVIRQYVDQLDAVVNNAGVSYIGLIQDMTAESWDELMEINLRAPFLVIKAALPGMLRAHEGVIVNISSMWGTYGASCEAAYSASKGGLSAFTKALAKELAPSGIRVNAIAAGAIDTSMNAFLSLEERKQLEDEIGLGRLGRPEEVADLILYLCSEKSSYLTGAIIPLDGGY
ncbi:MAG: SDR family oxidoreductase [Firmicutes bacterium]|nr:SDR family oxidoreductase [Bacillota bacterium]